jgi:hypothetical protein
MASIAGLALLLVLSQPMFAELTHVPEIGEELHAKDIPQSTGPDRCVTQAAQTYPCFDKLIDEVTYTVAFDDNNKNRVTYISTSDPKFQTADGYKVGDEIEFPRSQLQVNPYFEIYGPTTRDGWRPIVGLDLGPLEPEKDSRAIDLRGNTGKGDPIKTKISGFSKGKDQLDCAFSIFCHPWIPRYELRRH